MSVPEFPTEQFEMLSNTSRTSDGYNPIVDAIALAAREICGRLDELQTATDATYAKLLELDDGMTMICNGDLNLATSNNIDEVSSNLGVVISILEQMKAPRD